MNKFISLFIVFILSACTTPQVTVTSEVTVTLAPPTSIPTPTLHPDFIAWQELISSSGRYSLTPDGFIQEDGIVINDLQVDSSGIMILTVNNEKIILTTSDITFAEDGIKINGYELENGKWVEAISEQLTAIIEEMNAWDVDPQSYSCEEDGDTVICTDLDGNEILRDGQYDVFWLRETLVNSGDLVPTEYAPSTGNYLPGTPTDEARTEYLFGVLADEFVRSMIEEIGFDPTRDENGKLRDGKSFLLDPTSDAWGFVKNVDFGQGVEQVLLFETQDGGVEWRRVQDVDRQLIARFWQDQ